VVHLVVILGRRHRRRHVRKWHILPSFQILQVVIGWEHLLSHLIGFQLD
jgi:hypothetical protein